MKQLNKKYMAALCDEQHSFVITTELKEEERKAVYDMILERLRRMVNCETEAN